jgi:outer membrane protein assembly factor BamB
MSIGFRFAVAALGAPAIMLQAPAEDAKPESMIGYRGDGSCLALNSNPPVQWDGESGKNIVWAVELPNWSLGSPIVAKGRVFVMSEPDRDSDWPSLVCLDAANGKLLWKKDLDHIELMQMPEAQKNEVRKAWHDHLAALWTLNRMRHVYAAAPDKEAAKKTLEEHGCTADTKGVEWKGDGSKRGGRMDVQLARTFNRARLYFDVWHLGGMGRIGYAYPTPVSDGKQVYVATGLHAFACYDFEGNVKWKHFVPGQDTSNAGYGGNDYCKNARSPLLYKDLFISDVGSLVRAFDKRTGKLLWSDKINAHEIVTPVILTVGGQDLLLCGGLNGYTLPEGKKLAVEGWSNHGGTMLVKSDERDVVFFTGGGEHGGWENKGNPPCKTPPPAAVKFELDSGKLKAKVLWSGIEGKSSGECHAGILYHQGKLYHPHGHIFDAATGKLLKQGDRNRQRFTPATRHLTWLAGNRLYGVKDASRGGAKGGPPGGVCEVYDLDGKKLAENFLPAPKAQGERLERIIEIGCGGFSYGCPFAIFGDRIYVRANTALYCVGAK